MSKQPQKYWYKDELLTAKQIKALTGWSRASIYRECPKEIDETWDECDPDLKDALENRNCNELLDFKQKKREVTKDDFKRPVED